VQGSEYERRGKTLTLTFTQYGEQISLHLIYRQSGSQSAARY